MPKQKRFIVSDLGFAYAVHDTQVPQEYAHPAGQDKEHKSTNAYNTVRVELCATKAQAQRIANQLNEKAEREKRQAG